MMIVLEKFLYILSAIFYYPVVLVLLFLFARSIIDLGGFCREAWLRKKQRDYFTAPFQQEMQLLQHLQPANMELTLQTMLHDAEAVSQRRIRAARYIIKMGPTLGLVGTLTPMARALSTLSQGDLSALGNQMMTAFSTTVLGLVTGGIAFTIMHVRSGWQKKDLFRLSRTAEELFVQSN